MGQVPREDRRGSTQTKQVTHLFEPFEAYRRKGPLQTLPREVRGLRPRLHTWRQDTLHLTRPGPVGDRKKGSTRTKGGLVTKGLQVQSLVPVLRTCGRLLL